MYSSSAISFSTISPVPGGSHCAGTGGSRWVGGCRDVVNLLELVPAEADGDDEMSDVLHLVLETDPRVRAGQITVNVENHRITLAGWVATEAESRQAEQDAWCMDAIGGVVNRIQVHASI